MMKKYYSKLAMAMVGISFFSATVVLAENSTPGTTADRAQIAQDRKDARQEVRTQNVCERMTQFSDNLNQKASEKENNVKTRQEERLVNWENKISETDYKLENLRNGWDNNREEQFNKLEEKAQTDDQKEAVIAFKTATKNAIATRRTAVDAALASFRAEVKKAIQVRQGQVNGLISTSITSRADALAKVKADCDAGKDAATVRADFQNGLKGARLKMQSDRQEVTKISSNVQSLIQIRRTAVEKAASEFKSSMEKARIALKMAFPGQVSTTSDITTTD